MNDTIFIIFAKKLRKMSLDSNAKLKIFFKKSRTSNLDEGLIL